MSNEFFEHPILNSPYEYPARHWELDASGQPTQKIAGSRRRAEFVTPIPKPKKQRGGRQESLLFDERSTQEQQYDHQAVINAVRTEVDEWRKLPNPNDWRVTPETALAAKSCYIAYTCPATLRLSHEHHHTSEQTR